MYFGDDDLTGIAVGSPGKTGEPPRAFPYCLKFPVPSP